MHKLTYYFLLFFLGCNYLQAQDNGKPNVIVIYTDDQGAGDLGCYGADDIYTPNIDKLAENGIRFTQAYVAAPVCAPSRAALLTGNYPQRAGVPGNTSASTSATDGLPDEQYTMAELFKDNGYKTALVGKWHLGMSKESSPNNQGFDYLFGHLRGCIDNYSHFFFWEGPNIHDLHENDKEVYHNGKYFPDLMAEKVDAFIDKNQKDPFFLFYAINMPHYPYQPTEKWRKYYQEMGVPFPRSDYGAFISTIDERIGMLIDQLEKLGLRDDTIIVYQSDNGYSTEVRAFNGGGSSGSYRGAKSSLFEGGIRLPTIISWKNNLPENKVNNEFLLNTDWMPTLTKLCGLKSNKIPIDGIDLSSMLINTEEKSPRTSAFWKYGNQWVVRDGKWKLIGYPKDTSHKGELDLEQDALFLSNLDEDVSEMTNLASKHPEIVERLTKQFVNWEYGNADDVPKKVKKLDHLAIDASIVSSLPLHPNYKNIEVLTDGKRGYLDFSSGQWIGQEGKDLEFIIDLKKEQNINKISCGYLQNLGNWIFKPKQVSVSVSPNGKDFSKPYMMIDENEKLNDNTFKGKFSLEKSLTTRYLKINIKNIGVCPPDHEGAGSNAWMFIDEIEASPQPPPKEGEH
ncbi:sulfatase-like hydrolase/transferase [Aureibaculum sp. 2210JD6-5]|uniref:sulfatase-like hydrolase/transferase n=1 Tax=Aureibaculum sp. 2210JD6-5 TaxID=3103957 RepID=UPI002AAC68F6|nr:sulfatase-like hydrolase/transferase [Aureibaculum sp. 2210JD6-5]MDY7394299.1 sulfatase-like hydrolase/transferase [Aureibaculum sp. 2210JD6-5]